jgi:hypothetical protein
MWSAIGTAANPTPKAPAEAIANWTYGRKGKLHVEYYSIEQDAKQVTGKNSVKYGVLEKVIY